MTALAGIGGAGEALTADRLVEVQNGLLRDLFSRGVVLRLYLVPVLGTLMAGAVALDPAPWRIVGGVALFVSLTVVSLFEYRRWKRGGVAALEPNVVAMLWTQLGAVALTGGLQSPLVPVLPMATAQVVIVLGAGWAVAAIAGAQIAATWGFAALMATGHDLALPALGSPWPSSSPWVAATFLTVFIVASVGVGTAVRRLVREPIARALDAEEAERHAHQDHARELAAMSAEIAHELKNPLASVKGLAALLARDLQGRDAERLAVLRGEVDRMQERLDAFLTYSRPLVPLALEDVALEQVAADVAELCEGLARGAGVRVAVRGEGIAHVDRRKLRQILVNLVQNAIDAAPAGTEVEVIVDGAQVDVLDRGPGPGDDPERWFEAGSSGKATGNGLGLTIARALAAQMGGALTLAARDGGGARARVAW